MNPGQGNPYRQNSQWREFLSLVKSLAIFFGIAFMLRASVVEAFKIPSSSMEPTLQIGDHILVNKLSYGFRLPFRSKTVFNFRQPSRGDVVVFTRPDDETTYDIDESRTNIIKRVMALPGEVVQVKGRNVYIDGKLLKSDREYATWRRGGQKDFGPAVVPPNSVFLMGDNRDHSRDSRYWKDGHYLSMDRIKGRAFIVYWSFVDIPRMFNLIR